MPVIKVIPIQSLVTDDLALKDKNVVVVDILRAGSTMLTALSNGAKEIVPTETTNMALRVAKGSGKNTLLCGERGGKIIAGFNLGNSPFEYIPEKVSGKSLVFSTTNGTVSIHKSRYAKNCILASFLNFSKVIEFLDELNEDFIVMCSGKLNGFCLEDFVFAGAIINQLFKLNKKRFYEISDAELAAKNLAMQHTLDAGNLSQSKILEMFLNSEHGKYLKSIGFEKDLEYCANIDTHPYLPVFLKGVIKFKENLEAEEINKKSFKRIKLKGMQEK
jgi:2-phosphosulfolactate phosphatase